MSRLVLIDTSAWTHALRSRGGDSSARARVEQLLTDGNAAWCDPVRLELWSGVRGELERKKLKHMDQTIPRLPVTESTWIEACEVASRARSGGLTVPAMDALIFACAKVHGIRVEHVDRHFDLLAGLPST